MVKITRRASIEGEYVKGEIVEKTFNLTWMHESKQFNRMELRAFALELNEIADELNNSNSNSFMNSANNMTFIEKSKHE